MFAYSSNIKAEIADLTRKLANATDVDAMLRKMAVAAAPTMRQRIHVDGKDSNDQQIGEYSDNYMKVRTGVGFRKPYAIAKGNGKYNKGDQYQRPKYNRTNELKVVASLTSQMENDMSVIATGNGYGVGYTNPDNFQKSEWVEQTYDKEIFSLTDREAEITARVAINHVSNVIS